MRICHLSDSHLGAGEQYGRRAVDGLSLRQHDFIRTFRQAIDKIIALAPDLCVHSGDLFDSVRPTNRILAIAAAEFHRLAEQSGIPTVVILGNHDAPRQPYLGSAIEVLGQIQNLHLAFEPGVHPFRIGDIMVYGVPHVAKGEAVREFFTTMEIERRMAYSVLVTHGVVAGMPEFSMAELGEQEIPPEAFGRFDYVALGHYHNMRKVTERAWYAGSTERLSQAEREWAKGFLEITLEPYTVTPHYVPAREMLDLRIESRPGQTGEALVEELRAALESRETMEKIVRVTIGQITEETMRTIPAQSMSNLRRQTFSLDIRYQRADTPTDPKSFGRAGIGNLEDEFSRFVDVSDLAGFDRKRLLAKARQYLTPE